MLFRSGGVVVCMEAAACRGTNSFNNRGVVGDLQEQSQRSGREESLTGCVQGEMD